MILLMKPANKGFSLQLHMLELIIGQSPEILTPSRDVAYHQTSAGTARAVKASQTKCPYSAPVVLRKAVSLIFPRTRSNAAMHTRNDGRDASLVHTHTHGRVAITSALTGRFICRYGLGSSSYPPKPLSWSILSTSLVSGLSKRWALPITPDST